MPTYTRQCDNEKAHKAHGTCGGVQAFYFTFGCGSQLSKRFVKITAPSENAARLIMTEHFGRKWSFQYTEKYWVNEAGISQEEQYGYTLLAEFKADMYDHERAARQSTWDAALT